MTYSLSAVKIAAALDGDYAPCWFAFPTTEEEIQSALRDLGYQPVPNDMIDYDETQPDWNEVKPIWLGIRCPEPAN